MHLFIKRGEEGKNSSFDSDLKSQGTKMSRKCVHAF